MTRKLSQNTVNKFKKKLLAEQEQLRLRKLSTLRAGESAVQTAGLQAASTVLSGAMNYYQNS